MNSERIRPHEKRINKIAEFLFGSIRRKLDEYSLERVGNDLCGKLEVDNKQHTIFIRTMENETIIQFRQTPGENKQALYSLQTYHGSNYKIVGAKIYYFEDLNRPDWNLNSAVAIHKFRKFLEKI